MNRKFVIAAVCLLAGIPLTAYGLAERAAGLALAGLVLLMVATYFASAWLSKATKPGWTIKHPAANAAWAMRDRPADNGGAKEKDQ